VTCPALGADRIALVSGSRCSVELERTIYIASMSQFDYKDNQFLIPYLVNDSVLALSHAISVAAPAASGIRLAWDLPQAARSCEPDAVDPSSWEWPKAPFWPRA
jgi:hypothetical protein